MGHKWGVAAGCAFDLSIRWTKIHRLLQKQRQFLPGIFRDAPNQSVTEGEQAMRPYPDPKADSCLFDRVGSSRMPMPIPRSPMTSASLSPEMSY